MRIGPAAQLTVLAACFVAPFSGPARAAGASSSPASKVVLVRSFSPARDKPLTITRVEPDQGGWRIDVAGPGPVRLFEVAGDTCDACRLLYRAKVKARDLALPGFLEMWVRLPEKGQFFSRGLDQAVSGSVDWTSVEIPFFLKKGERPDLVKLNVSFQGAGGSLWIKDVELLRGPLP